MLGALLTLLALHALPCHTCIVDEDCSLNGVCSGAQCVCDPGWRGGDCGVLNLAPAVRYSGYNLTGNGTSSWGGKVVQDPAEPTLHHLFAAEFTGGCGLDYWSPMSRIIRAESRTGPAGPYAFAQEVVGTFAHNPTVVWSAAEQLYLMYHIGCPYPQPASCSTPHFSCAPGDGANAESGITVRTSKDLRSWQRLPGYALGVAPGAWDEDNTNPSALVLANGSVVLAYRGCPAECRGAELLGLALAPCAAGPYTRTSPAASILPQDATEDPNLWQDARGHWHMLSHSLEPGGGWGGGPKVGRHAFARDLLGSWTWGNTSLAYSTTVAYTDGTVDVLNRRERPQLLFAEASLLSLPVCRMPAATGTLQASQSSWSA
jgi:hypothetical protein